jgi:membrane-associated phospholipid phosphatase
MGDIDRLLFAHWNLSPLDPDWAVVLAIWCVVTVLLLGPRRWRLAGLQVALAMAVVWVLVLAISRHRPQPRPFIPGIGQLRIDHGPTSGFPSRHAAVGMAFEWSALRVIPTRWVGLLCLGKALLIARNRVALGVYIPVDVFAGEGVCSAPSAIRANEPPRCNAMAPSAHPNPFSGSDQPARLQVLRASNASASTT